MDTGGVYSAAISSDGRYLAVGRTNMFELWDTVKGGEGKITESYGIRTLLHSSSVLMADFLQSEDTGL